MTETTSEAVPQSGGRDFKDYDALNAEKQAFVRHIGGRDIELKKILPAKLVLDIRRMDAANLNEAQEEDFGFKMIENILGPEDWEHITAHLGIRELTELITDVLRYYGFGSAREEASSEEGKAEESPSTPASNTSEPSTQTSNGSTRTQEEPSTQEPSHGESSSAVSDISPMVHSS
jgi:hypothetical protein